MTAVLSNLKRCRGKFRFSTRAEGQLVAAHLQGPTFLSTFHCPACGGFHNGRQANSDKRRPKMPAYEARCERRYGPSDMREA